MAESIEEHTTEIGVTISHEKRQKVKYIKQNRSSDYF